MIAFLRTVGVLNAALWFGSAVFFTFVAGPAFFSESMLSLLGRPYAGAAVMVILARYFVFQQICVGVALAHMIAESLYVGRPFLRWRLAVLAGVLALVLVAGYGIQPKLKRLHRTIYTASNPEEVQQTAQKSFRIWHGVSQALNLVVVGGIMVYLLRVTRISDASRYRTFNTP